ncbi:anthranilate synthase component I [Calidifontibacillus oryziterrae]|uniref:anthranilate synthase component I n=1 Tax=Calidifontibacillus oryziterrae TaxID=1191699 RepID=UPI0002DCBAAF|nr:anthranilate synthase component I [Calidifontibacillus oryziterrae]
MNTYDCSTFLEDAKQHLTIPIVKRYFVDTITPIQIFQSLKEEACFLLESKDEASPWSRYSFIGLTPFLYVEEKDGVFFIKNQMKQTVSITNTFRGAFQRSLEMLQIKKPDLSLPFWGGAVGIMGYDSVSTFEKVPEHNHNDLKLKRFSFMFCETMVAFDHDQKELTIIQLVRLNGNETTKEQQQLYDNCLKKINVIFDQIFNSQVNREFLQIIDPTIEADFSNVTSNYVKENFLKDVNTIKEYIKSGDIFQAVLSQRFEIPINIQGFELYRVLRMINPSPYLFYVKLDDCELIGSSPERLIQIENGHLEIHPIAGTRRRGRSKEEDEALAAELFADQKERAEHYMLVDLARNDIGRVAKYGSVNTPVLMELGKFSHVMHLISKVTGVLKEGIDPIDALFSAFPAGTVSGAPKIRAMQILQELEPTARNLYAGTVAYLGFDGNIDSCIAIRTIVLKDRKAYVQAGAGVVADSIPELEYKETLNKASALIKTIQIAEKMFYRGEKQYV